MDNKWLNGKRKVCRSKVKRLEKCKLFKKTVEIIDRKKNLLNPERLLHQKFVQHYLICYDCWEIFFYGCNLKGC